MIRKSFQTYSPSVGAEFSLVEGGQGGKEEVFHLRPSVPGDVLLDFIAKSDSEEVGQVAETVRGLLAAAIVEEDFERWTTFIRKPANNVTLTMLAEIAGWISEQVSGKDPAAPQPLPSGVG